LEGVGRNGFFEEYGVEDFLDSGLSVNGFGKEALEFFGAMERERLRPTEITLSRISVCL